MTHDTTPHTPGHDPADDPRVLQAARDYLAELEAGHRPDRRAYEARHPDLAAAVAECLDGVELAHGIGALRGPPAAATVPQLPLGDFQIVREIGRGGMGIVYEATQLSLGRRVALKVLPFAAALDAKQLQRFRTESHAAAQLLHPNIVPVYAVGCERGTHYYAMQIIDGQPLDAYIRDLRTDAAPVDVEPSPTASTVAPGTPTRPATAAQRQARHHLAARIACQVAEALEYAHEAGVVHRDIKPANLLLDARGTVWITDFGLAQVTAVVGGVTRTGDVFGTLRYMSPEQAAGRRVEVDHRTDVYSLGATLYELLTREPIFPAADRQTLLNQILHEEPTPLRALDRHLPEELETIVLKATAKLPAERYATAGELAGDLRRYLDDRPILARRPTTVELARKWMRRHPSAVRAALAVSVAGTLGFGVSTAVVVREQGRTEVAYKQAERRAAEAEERFQLARRSADEMIRLADEELADDPRQQPLRRKMLESALAYYQELIERRRDEADASTEDLEATRARVTAILSDLAVMQGAWLHLVLRDPAVQAELKLTPEQGAEVDAITREIAAKGDGPGSRFGRLKPDDRSARILADIRRHDAQITSVLRPEQFARLRQIGWQVRGPEAFRDPDLAVLLKLSPAQREQLRGLDDGPPPRPPGKDYGGPGFRPGGPPDGKDFGKPGGPPGRPRRGPGMAPLLAVLTPEQRTRWVELTGEPFPFERDDRTPYGR